MCAGHPLRGVFSGREADAKHSVHQNGAAPLNKSQVVVACHVTGILETPGREKNNSFALASWNSAWVSSVGTFPQSLRHVCPSVCPAVALWPVESSSLPRLSALVVVAGKTLSRTLALKRHLQSVTPPTCPDAGNPPRLISACNGRTINLGQRFRSARKTVEDSLAGTQWKYIFCLNFFALLTPERWMYCGS